VIPGFGVVGITGIVLMVAALVLAAIGNIRFNFGVIPFREVFKASMTVLGGLGLGIIGIIYMSSRIGKRGFLRKVALSADQEGFISVPMEPASLVGSVGVAATDLRPSGRVLLDGEYYDANSLKGFIDKGDEVEVVRYENFQLYVRKKR